MTPVPLGVLVATLGGLAIGIERQWSGHASGPEARFGGIRTFALLGGTAGLAGSLWSAHVEALAIVLLAAAAALVVAAYSASSRADVDATTEVGALVVLAAGVLAGLGQLVLSSGVVAVTTLVLVEKSTLHAWVARIADEELRAAARFAVMAAVVLPLLPPGPFGPWGMVLPREVWLLVLLFSGLSFAGYIARRAIGPRHGYSVSGLLGGLVSSTSVTLTFARTSRAEPRQAHALALGAVAACTVLFVRVAVATLVLNPALAVTLLRYLVAPFVLGVVAFAGLARMTGHGVLAGHHGGEEDDEVEPSTANPLQLLAALQMAAVFQVVLVAVEAARRVFGSAGLVASGAILGLTDVDALTLSMARGAASGVSNDLAARAIVTGLLANTGLKLAVALVIGSRRFAQIVGGCLAATAMVLAAVLAW